MGRVVGLDKPDYASWASPKTDGSLGTHRGGYGGSQPEAAIEEPAVQITDTN